jgi:hypothetical protein
LIRVTTGVGAIIVKTEFLLHVALPFILTASFQVQAISFETTERKLQQYAIDPEQLSGLLNKQVSDWQTFTPREKEIFAKGMIIYSDMETSNNADLLEKHVQSTIRCMDTKGHGLKLPPSEDISLPLVRCIGDTNEAYRQKSPTK